MTADSDCSNALPGGRCETHDGLRAAERIGGEDEGKHCDNMMAIDSWYRF